MRLCLTCRRLSKGGTRYCSYCGCSWGGHICDRGHEAPSGAAFCGTCGSDTLSEATPYLSLFWLPRLLSVAMSALAFRWAVYHLPALLCATCLFARWGLAVLFGVSPQAVGQFAANALQWALFCLVVSSFIPGEAGRTVRRVIWDILRFLLRLLSRLVALGSRTLGSALRESDVSR